MDSYRLILDPPASGARNMAVDEVLLESAIEDETATVRVYAWSEPTVSLGYFQKAEEIARDPKLAGLSAVRRLSGGGAILHHHEVTYSLAIPATHSLASEPSRLYRQAHHSVMEVLTEMAAAAPAGRRRNVEPLRMRGETNAAANGRFLCFGRGDPNDVVLGSHKIMGSAQRRRRGAVLQHGSLLLRASPHAAEYPGLYDLADLDVPPDRLAEQVGWRMAASVCGEWVSGALTASEEKLAARLAHEKYSQLTWSGAEATGSKTSALQTT